jgi:hypothetical protein
LTHADRAGRGGELAQQLEPLADQRVNQLAHAGEVAARTVETRYQSRFDRVAAHREDDWNGGRCPLRGLRGYRSTICGDQRRLAIDQIGRHPWQPVKLTFGPAKFHGGNIPALDEAGFAKTLPECLDQMRPLALRPAVQKSDQRHCRLRARRERPSRRRATQNTEKIPPLHIAPRSGDDVVPVQMTILIALNSIIERGQMSVSGYSRAISGLSAPLPLYPR